MKQAIPTLMRAVAIDHFGGPEVLKIHRVPVPEKLGVQPSFPYVLGSEGAGVVAAVGEQVDRFAEGDRDVARTFPLERLADAHRALDEHYLGKLALRVH